MNYDDQVLGTQNPLHPFNQEELDYEPTFMEQLQEKVEILGSQIDQVEKSVVFRKSHNAKIIEFIKSTYAEDYELLHNKLDELL